MLQIRLILLSLIFILTGSLSPASMASEAPSIRLSEAYKSQNPMARKVWNEASTIHFKAEAHGLEKAEQHLLRAEQSFLELDFLNAKASLSSFDREVCSHADLKKTSPLLRRAATLRALILDGETQQEITPEYSELLSIFAYASDKKFTQALSSNSAEALKLRSSITTLTLEDDILESLPELEMREGRYLARRLSPSLITETGWLSIRREGEQLKSEFKVCREDDVLQALSKAQLKRIARKEIPTKWQGLEVSLQLPRGETLQLQSAAKPLEKQEPEKIFQMAHAFDESSLELERESASASWLRSPWFWVGVGAVVGTGTYFAVSSQSSGRHVQTP